MLTLYEAYALTVPPSCLYTYSEEGAAKPLRKPISQHVCEQPPTCGVAPWCQVLDPALAGLCHSLDPNTMLTEEGRLVAARAIVAGEQLTCDFGGYMRVCLSQVEHERSRDGKQASLESDPEPPSTGDISAPTVAVLDGLAIAIHAAACVCLNAGESHHSETRQACCLALSSEWVATRLQKLAVALQHSDSSECGRQCHWGYYAARVALLRMSFATGNTTKD